MLLLVLIFASILSITFGLMVVMTRPSKEEVKVQRRFAGLRTNLGSNEAAQQKELGQLLAKPEPSSFAWMERIVNRTAKSNDLRLLILQSNSRRTVGGLVSLCMVCAAVGLLAVYVVTKMTLIALVAGSVMGYSPIIYLRFKRSKRVAAFEKQLPDCIEMAVRALRAGYSIVAALGIAADQTLEPAKTEFSEVFKKQSYGLPMRDALMQMLERMPSNDLRVLVTGILVQKDTGGNLAELMERMADVIRQRMRIQGEIRIHTAQGRLTGWILCMLPVVLLVLMNVINPGYSNVLFTDEVGRDLLYGGVVMLLLGGFLIRNIINGIEV